MYAQDHVAQSGGEEAPARALAPAMHGPERRKSPHRPARLRPTRSLQAPKLFSKMKKGTRVTGAGAFIRGARFPTAERKLELQPLNLNFDLA